MRYGRENAELEIKIYTSSEAFDTPEKAAAEIATILKDIADGIKFNPRELNRYVRDVNGNRVGSVDYEYTTDDDFDDNEE